MDTFGNAVLFSVIYLRHQHPHSLKNEINWGRVVTLESHLWFHCPCMEVEYQML